MIDILHVDDNCAEVDLLREALTERNVLATVREYPTVAEAQRFIRVRFTSGGVPPPNVIVIGASPRDEPFGFITFLRDHAVLGHVPVVLIGDAEWMMNTATEARQHLDELRRNPRCTVVPRAFDWDGQLALVDRILALLRQPEG